MVKVKEGSLLELIQKGLVRSKTYSKPILVSKVERIKNIDPLLFFVAAKMEFEGERIFWSDPSNTVSFVGLGNAFMIENSGDKNRYQCIEDEWNQLLEHHISSSEENHYGTGPQLFGGFSFDPLKENTELWGDFSDARFVLPKIMLSIIENKAWLTTNVICMDETLDKINEFEELIQQIIDNAASISPPNDKFHFHKSEVEPQKWLNSVKRAAQEVRNGEVEKIVLAREVRLTFTNRVHSDPVLANLREEQPMSYLFAFESKDSCFIGASPERLIKKEGNQFFTTCLAGSIRRGKTEREDDQLARELLSDNKNLIEHDVVVQMIKKAMVEACSSIISPPTPEIYKMRDIQHLYTPVTGIAKDGVSLLFMVERLHPTPALGGQPKQKAIEKIRELEVLDRGWYGSPIGWLDAYDNGEFAVAIRSGLLQGKEASLFAGCGIVGDSEPESEYNETNIKFKPMLSALGGGYDGN